MTWHSSWKVKMHTTIIFNQKTLMDAEWVHSFHLTWEMYYQMILLETPWNGLENSHWRSKSLKGVLRSFHQKKWKHFFCDCSLSSIELYISIPTSWKNEKKWSNVENIGDTLDLSLKCLVLHAVTNTWFFCISSSVLYKYSTISGMNYFRKMGGCPKWEVPK